MSPVPHDASILVVDDEFSVRDSLSGWFGRDGYRVETADSGEEALDALQRASFDVLLLDIRMPGMGGMELLEHVRKLEPSLPVIMITAFASVETAVVALKQGAFDYVTKPIDPDELSRLVERAVQQRRLTSENVQLRQRVDDLIGTTQIVGNSPAMKKVMELVRHVAATEATVLIRGESGTGKELIARAIHANSSRRYHALVPVNCGALPEGILESELFGHEKGAFTGAQFRRKGKLEQADGGTLFLDEIGTISTKTQVDLLRVLESHEFCRVGGTRPVTSDFRVICATHQDLEEAVKAGTFREDFYYRINVFTIELPPLRERPEDIPLLAHHFLESLSFEMDRQFTDISNAAMKRLHAHRWPGNVRELANAIERAVVVGTPPTIREQDLPGLGREGTTTAFEGSLADMERLHIARTLDRTGWNITRAAAILKVDRATLYSKIKKYELRR